MEEVQSPGVEQEPIALPKPIIYEQADLKLQCTCGHTTVLETNVPKGAMRYEVYTVEGSTLPLMCEECGHKLTLFFDPAENPTIVDEQPKIESVQETDAETSEDDRTIEPRGEEQQTEEEEIMTPFIYSVIVDESIKNENGKYDMVMYSDKIETENPILLFDSETQLTRAEVLKIVEGTPNLIKVGGDFKETENESVPEERQA